MERRKVAGFSVLVLGFAASAAMAAPAGDYPGKHFQVTPADLPKPFATPATDNSSTSVARPAGAMLQAPKGFTVSVYASGLPSARWMAMAPNGDVFLAEPSANRVAILRGADKATVVQTFADGFQRPHGLAFHDGALYVGDANAVWKIEYKDGALKGGKKTRITKSDFPKGGHATRDIGFDADGKLYVAIGSAGNIEEGEPAERAAVSTVNPDGTLTQFATGLRNPVAIVNEPGTNTMWVTVNERDGYGDGLVPDYLTHIEKGAFYGWPYAYIGHTADPTYGSRRPDLVARATTPDLLFQSHSAPLGLVFYEGAQFPADYKGDVFVSLHGSWNSATPTGYKVVHVKIANGKPAGGYDDFLTGFAKPGTSPAQVWGRPAGLLVAKDGSLLVADDAGKTVWRVAYTGK